MPLLCSCTCPCRRLNNVHRLVGKLHVHTERGLDPRVVSKRTGGYRNFLHRKQTNRQFVPCVNGTELIIYPRKSTYLDNCNICKRGKAIFIRSPHPPNIAMDRKFNMEAQCAQCTQMQSQTVFFDSLFPSE